MFDPGSEKADLLQSCIRDFIGAYLHAHADEARGASLLVHPALRQKFVDDLRAKPIKATQVDLEKWSWAVKKDKKGKPEPDEDKAYTRLAIDYTNKNSIIVKRMYLDLTWNYVEDTWLITDGLFPGEAPLNLVPPADAPDAKPADKPAEPAK